MGEVFPQIELVKQIEMKGKLISRSVNVIQSSIIYVQVVIRIRPPLPRELQGAIPFKSVVAVDSREQVITISDNLEAVLDERGEVMNHTGHMTHSFVFDYVYDQNCTQKKVYETSARPGVDSALQGYNATIFACKRFSFTTTFTNG